jgi:chemotaxis response regulator CheB
LEDLRLAEQVDLAARRGRPELTRNRADPPQFQVEQAEESEATAAQVQVGPATAGPLALRRIGAFAL